jgi:hypothetical protein
VTHSHWVAFSQSASPRAGRNGADMRDDVILMAAIISVWMILY